MDLVIEPVTSFSWARFKAALKAEGIQPPKARPPFGLMLTAPLAKKRRPIAGACLFPIADIVLLLYPFSVAWEKPEMTAELAPHIANLGATLANLAFLLHGSGIVALPREEADVLALQAMGFTKPIAGLSR